LELARPDHFSSYDPDHLLASQRYPAVVQKLDAEVDSKAVICLQEVSTEWAGLLHQYFANRGYHMVTGLYGKKFSGYMGVALDVDISRLSDKREGGCPEQPDDETDGFGKLWAKIRSGARQPLVNFGLAERELVEPWEMSQYRHNILVTATLKDRASGRAFCLGTYHMPCAFYAPQVMTVSWACCIVVVVVMV